MTFQSVYGVDFSGAKLAGENIWIAQMDVRRGAAELVELSRLRSLCGAAERGPALAHLVERIARSERALWGMDFPFGLPIEVLPDGCRWPEQLAHVSEWDDAYALGEECVRRARALGGPMHIRRTTDDDARTPFDCYHYRIIYQTYHGMRDVLAPLARVAGTAILPFHYRRLSKARRVVVESCPGSTLKRLGLPHQNYKQPAGGPLTARRLRTRRAILEGLARFVRISPSQRNVIMRNGGGDALDAVIAAVGAAHGFDAADHQAIARHPRYPREGRLYV
ncbi:MAG TPA: hypothetical protein VGI81_18575 [Tepidisphaeraceae bacterium]